MAGNTDRIEQRFSVKKDLLWGISQALPIQNWSAGLASLVVFLPLYLLRVPHEERMMLEQFGEEYCLYMNRTGRVIPRFQG
jgi:protein-S-isoprenylcysteine O-methyltransferase Ste14